MNMENYFCYIHLNEDQLREIRVRSLWWVMDCYKSGTIRKKTIQNLIDKSKLDELLDFLVQRERYEDCIIVKQMLDEFYA